MALRTDDSKTLAEKVDALREAVARLTDHVLAPRAVLSVGPQQITVLSTVAGGELVTVTYPVGSTTVLSVQPDGTFETRPAGSCGPYETGLKQSAQGRIVYAPIGPGGPAYLIALTDAIPNA
jgi:hypothetical protein